MNNVLNLRIDDKTKNILSKNAKEMGLSLSAYARLILQRNSIQIIDKKNNIK